MTHALQTLCQTLLQQLNTQIIGQGHLTERMLMTLLCDGHLLVEGPPGLAKTRAIKTLAAMIEGDYHRIQFTPDLLPSDITGTEIYRQETGQFELQKGPIFQNLVLADEINRAPAKVQSALLEAMAEEQVTVGKHTLKLEKLFMVMATQNPIEQEGTYPLPEAQLDRFLMHVRIDYPDRDAEKAILTLTENEARQEGQTTDLPRLTQADLFAARQAILDVHLNESLQTYIIELVMASREPDHYDANLARYIDYGVSPRATLALARTARAHAWLNGRDYVTPDDVQAVVHDIFRHRLLLSFEAEAADQTPDSVVDALLERVPVV
ncbi:MoxR family ATPase [Thiomicrospira sp. WB1]|uniref:AAA family ATPase n=1 Tax=Thiomicrospira sp. WB1 TaxID=1685380 RepID=UPI0007464BD9|nr:MoxR family ATPase [Thiomicrospira sp. WB1]KUJ72266.1 AAA family ATPase [Thiomicrospira sp. WB1]